MSRTTNLQLAYGVNPNAPVDASGSLASVPGQNDSSNDSLKLAWGINPNRVNGDWGPWPVVTGALGANG